MSSPSTSQPPSREILARKWDRCLSNTLTASALGLAVGIGLSVLFFRRRAWPVALGAGFGLGAAYDDCSRSFNPDVALGQQLQRLAAAASSEPRK
ncbi:hypothetical protein HK405_002926 [Cladochytrium tenue]|nr:hypothetical protein HK405_002926 [Cladochytrium tenue]